MQEAILALVRDNISDSLVTELRNMIVDGRLPASERINEVQLSRALGVSRTPLREALARIAQEGALKGVPRIGYFVQPLTIEEFEQLYQLRPILDQEALRIAGIPSGDSLQRLLEINENMKRARDADTIIGLDDDFHLELISNCSNKVLIDFIKQMIQRTRRYETALMRERNNVLHATEDHERILQALHKRDLEAACSALKQNMLSGRAPIVEWLAESQDDRLGFS